MVHSRDHLVDFTAHRLLLLGLVGSWNFKPEISRPGKNVEKSWNCISQISV